MYPLARRISATGVQTAVRRDLVRGAHVHTNNLHKNSRTICSGPDGGDVCAARLCGIAHEYRRSISSCDVCVCRLNISTQHSARENKVIYAARSGRLFIRAMRCVALRDSRERDDDKIKAFDRAHTHTQTHTGTQPKVLWHAYMFTNYGPPARVSPARAPRKRRDEP